MSKMCIVIWLMVFSLTMDSQGQMQSKTKRVSRIGQTSLVGTWRLLELTNLDSATGKWIHPFGEHPRGYFTYTRTNILNINISSEKPLTIPRDSMRTYSINYRKLTSRYSMAYFGTYSVDLDKSVVMHHVKGGSVPWYVDTDQPRPYKVKGDTLVIGDNKTYRRVLVRVD